jgi:RNA polymerase sigma-70 factor (ECF subfamily)
MRANELSGCGNDFVGVAPRTATGQARQPIDYTKLSDKAWIARIQAGEEESARAMIERLSPLVLKCVRSHRAQRTSEEDLVQVVFAKIFTKLSQFGGDVPLEHWVSRVTINTCLKQIQYEGSRPEWRWGDLAVEEQAILDRLTSTQEDLNETESAAARELVDKLLQGLSRTDRMVVTMVHLEGRSMEEVSKTTGWSANAVKVRVYRARQKMRTLLESMMAREAVGACLPEAVRLRSTTPKNRMQLSCPQFATAGC